VPERFVTSIAVGQPIYAFNTAYGDKAFNGRIISLDSRIDPLTRTLKIRAEIPNRDLKLRPGMLLNVNIERQVDTVLHVPESAVIPIEDKHYVFLVDGEKAARKTIEIGRRQPGIVEVISGVSQGEQVVIEGALKLRDGSQVNVLENQE